MRGFLRGLSAINLVALIASLNQAFPTNKYIMIAQSILLAMKPSILPDTLSAFFANKNGNGNGHGK